MTASPHNIALEPAAQKFVEATATPPFLYQLPPEEGRKTVDEVRRSRTSKPRSIADGHHADPYPIPC